MGIRTLLKSTMARLGLEVRRTRNHPPIERSPEFEELWARARPYTMTSFERAVGLYDAVRHVEENQVPGAFVECGVWRGGSAMMMALTLLKIGRASRDIHLFDTFEGMTPPTCNDVDLHGAAATETYEPSQSPWCYASVDEVRQNLLLTGYPAARVRLFRGRVEETIPAQAPEAIALLRLDTDWYESTKHELTHLFPRLSPGGVLIIDDYGHWQGARRAVDEYFEEQRLKPLLFRTDYTGRMMRKDHFR